MSVNVLIESIGVSTAELAAQLADAYERKSAAELDARKFAEQATLEASKLSDLSALLERIRDRDRKIAAGLPPPSPVRRMDPMTTYDAGAVAKELETIKLRAVRMNELSAQAATRAATLGREITELQVKIRKENEAEKARSQVRKQLGLRKYPGGYDRAGPHDHTKPSAYPTHDGNGRPVKGS